MRQGNESMGYWRIGRVVFILLLAVGAPLRLSYAQPQSIPPCSKDQLNEAYFTQIRWFGLGSERAEISGGIIVANNGKRVGAYNIIRFVDIISGDEKDICYETVPLSPAASKRTGTLLPLATPLVSGSSLASGVASYLATFADLNGDGIPDMVATAQGSAQVAVHLGNPDGSLQPSVFYKVGSTPSSIAIADVNGDGAPDLIVTNFDPLASNYVSVLLGKGDGTFQAAGNLAVGMYPMSVAAGDFNGDGKPDLAVAATDALYVMLGNGDGSFQAPVSIFTGNGGLSVVAADFNGDGKLDLALGQQASSGGAVAILLGNGNGTFQNPIFLNSGPGNADSLAFGDFNNDGALDLAISHALADSISILLGNGDGTFQQPTTYVTGGMPAGFSMLDFFWRREPRYRGGRPHLWRCGPGSVR